jgi:DNA-binding LacI/PurR family transcriptional regulator
MTLGALQALHERGLQIPSDVAIVGFDDMAWATSLQPPLTAVAQPTYKLGTTAARLLLARLSEPHRALEHIVLDTHLMVRASCGAPQTTDGAAPEGALLRAPQVMRSVHT